MQHSTDLAEDSAGDPHRVASRGIVMGMFSGAVLPFRATLLILGTKGLKRHALLPVLANAVVYAGALALFFWAVGRVDTTVSWEFWGPVGSWLTELANWSLTSLKWIVAIPLGLALSYFSFTTVGMIIMAPFGDLMSARVEQTLCTPQDEVKLPIRTSAALFLGAMAQATRIVVAQIFWVLLTLPLLLIPVVGSVPLLLVLAYFAGLGFFDIAMARHPLGWKHKKPMAKRRRWELVGFGLVLELLFPLIGLFALPIGAAGGTLLFVESNWDAVWSTTNLSPPPSFRAPKRAKN